MSRSVTKFVVGSIRPGVATLVSGDHEVVEFPVHLLPPGVFIGAVVELAVAVRPEHQNERLATINRLFEDIEREASSEATAAAGPLARRPRRPSERAAPRAAGGAVPPRKLSHA